MRIQCEFGQCVNGSCLCSHGFQGKRCNESLPMYGLGCLNACSNHGICEGSSNILNWPSIPSPSHPLLGMFQMDFAAAIPVTRAVTAPFANARTIVPDRESAMVTRDCAVAILAGLGSTAPFRHATGQLREDSR